MKEGPAVQRGTLGDYTLDTETRHCIRNFRVHETIATINRLQVLYNRVQEAYRATGQLTWKINSHEDPDHPLTKTWVAIAYCKYILLSSSPT